MEKIKPVTRPIECDLYAITMVDGVKCISVKGQLFEDNDSTWILSRYPLLIMDLKNFIENRRTFDYDFIYAGYLDLDESENFAVDAGNEAAKFMNTFFDGETADAYLDYSKLTMDTPCGNYVSKEDVNGEMFTELANYKIS